MVVNNTSTPEISVIIPVYNMERTVGRAIASILNQDPVKAEVIVIDDGSTDGSASAVEAFGDVVTCVKQINTGPSSARNHGARIASGRSFLFLDADDELAPGALDAHLKVRQAFRDIRLSVSSFTVMEGDYIERIEWLADRVNLSGGKSFYCVDEFLAPLVINIALGAICVDRDVFEDIGGFDVQLHCWEITDFMYRAYLATQRLGLIAERHVVKHEDRENGHFARMSQNTTYRARFATRILGRIHHVPESERATMLRQVHIALRWLARTGNVQEFRKLAANACPVLRQYGYSARVCKLTWLPDWIVRKAAPVAFWITGDLS